MTTNPPEAPVDDGAGPDGSPDEHGPRVTRDEVRDLARLRRSRTDRHLAGVGGGLARHFDIDPVIPRVVLAVLTLFGGAGLLLYVVLWLIVPAEGSDEATVRLDDRNRTIALVVTAVLAALALVGDSVDGWGFPWPLVVAGLVILVLLGRRDERRRTKPGPGAGPEAGPGAVTYDAFVRPSRRRGPVLFWYAVAIIALGVGVLGIADTAGAEFSDSAYPAVALGTCAVLLLVGAFWGRAGGLILLGLVSAVATAGATAATEVDAGHIEATPASAAAVQERYDLAFGEIELDLTEVADPEELDGETVEVEMEVAGRIEVVVPDDLDLVVRTSIEAGERRVFGERLGDGEDRTSTSDGGPGAPELTLDISTTFGEIEIIREDANR